MTSDAELVLRARDGDAEAFGELWSRHYRSGIAVARSLTAKLDPDDLVQEAYARILQAIQRGGGPAGSFRAYLFTSIRNTAASWGRTSRETTIDEIETLVDPDSTEQALDEALDQSLTAQAFRSLPHRWQEVLWYTEVEQMKPAVVAPLLGMSAGAVSQLAFRAREGLREAWIRAHLNSAPEDSECRWVIDSLGAYARDNLSRRDRNRLEEHLPDCARCMIVAAEAQDVSGRLAVILLPLVLGVGGASAYLASLQGGGEPLVALAAMPNGLAEAAAAGGPGGAGGTSGAGGSGTAAGAATSAGASAAASTGGMLGGIGVLVGAGALAVVGAVAAAALVLPGLFSSPLMSAEPPETPGSSIPIDSEVGPDPDSVPDTQPSETELGEPEAEDDTSANPPPDGSTPMNPTDPGDPEEPGDPEPPTAPDQPLAVGTAIVTCEVLSEDDPIITRTHYWVPVMGEPGWTVRAHLGSDTANAVQIVLDGAGNGTIVLQPMFAQVYLNVPATFAYTAEGTPVGSGLSLPLHELGDPVGHACGSSDEDPHPDDDGPVIPDEPSEPLGVGTATVTCEITIGPDDQITSRTHYWVPVTGEPGWTVRAHLESDTTNAVEVVLSAAGTGTIVLRPMFAQVYLNVPATFQYVQDGEPVGWGISLPLHELGDPVGHACGADDDDPFPEEP